MVLGRILNHINKHKEGYLVSIGLVGSVYGGLVIWKDYRAGKKYDMPLDEDPKNAAKKVYLITGANSGILRSL